MLSCERFTIIKKNDRKKKKGEKEKENKKQKTKKKIDVNRKPTTKKKKKRKKKKGKREEHTQSCWVLRFINFNYYNLFIIYYFLRRPLILIKRFPEIIFDVSSWLGSMLVLRRRLRHETGDERFKERE